MLIGNYYEIILRMKKKILILLCSALPIFAFSQRFAIKNNLLYDATLTPNLGIEFGMGKKNTLDINANYNPFEFSNNKMYKHWLVQPELRLWICEKFNRTFFGIHAHGGEFNVSGVKLPFNIFPSLETYKYQGYFYGGGISVGYQWILGKRWNLEASVGGGYARVHYDKYYCKECSPLLESSIYNYWGLTKATLSIVYFIR